MRIPTRALSLLLLVPLPALAQEVRIAVSSGAGDRLTEKPAARFAPVEAGGGTPAPVAFRIDDAERLQTMEGFGAAFNEAGMICLNRLGAARQEEVLARIFDRETGAGLSLMKLDLGGNDFMSAGPWYTYAEKPGDTALESFSIARDLGPNGVATFARRARRHGEFRLQAYMDYPPDWMLVDPVRFQDVDERYFDTLARYYLRYVEEYGKLGLAIDFLSPFNEPGIYTKIPFWKIRDLLRDHVGPLFERAGVKTRLQTPEFVSRENAYWNAPTVLDDPGARRFLTAIAYHGYDEPVANTEWARAMLALHERYPDLPQWMTEYCHAYQAGTPKSLKLPALDFDDGDFWGNRIFTDVEARASAWLYWNLILDEKGGPWAVSPAHGNPDPNVQHAIVVVDRTSGQVTWTGAYWYLAHFSRYVRPGAVRIGVRPADRPAGGAAVRCLAFLSPDGGHVAQLLNSSRQPRRVAIEWRSRSVVVDLPARSIATARWPAD
jgi:glucosylceramidase